MAGSQCTSIRKSVGCVCVHCGATFTSVRPMAKCCSRACVLAHLAILAVARAAVYTCRQCGKEGRKSKNYGEGLFCSRQCSGAYRTARSQERISAARAIRAAERDTRRVERAAIRAGARRAAEAAKYGHPRVCAHCGAGFLTQKTGGQQRHKYCSPECSRKHSHRESRKKNPRKSKKHEERARLYGVPRTYGIKPLQVYARDGWRCGLCGGKVNKRLFGTNHNEGPSLDHIVPLSVAGSPGHVMSNLQCAHRSCNSRKRVEVRGQLRMF